MRNNYLVPILFLLTIITLGCKENKASLNTEKSIVSKAETQYTQLYNSAINNINDANYIPRTIQDGKLRLVSSYDWTSGFYAGSLWYLHALTKNEDWKTKALQYTSRLDTIQYWEGNHDVGFMIECSYGNAFKDEPTKEVEKVIIQTAKSLSTRFHPKAGIIQSWEKSEKWNCPVIVDNMMNLELLFNATKLSGDSTYYNVAITHADTTIKNHFREDNSSYHVLDYDIETGEILARNTHQGAADNSAWARGQAWGLYGYTVCYRVTKDVKYLDQAMKIAEYIRNHPRLPEDKVPYWDYDSPEMDVVPRDASAAAITASALYELSAYTEDKKQDYLDLANEIMTSLKSPSYFAEVGTNKGFLLKHSVGSLPHEVEIDVPLNYADYYFLEALYRSKSLN